MRALAVASVVAFVGVALPAAAAAPVVPRLDHVVVVVFENHERDAVIGNASAPTFNRLASRYADLEDYDAVTHPSLPNYLALVSGSTQGITDDCTSCSAHGVDIGTLLSRAHRTWGGYAEGYPSSSRFAKKHMPFLYFAGQAGHVHPLTALSTTSPPAFAFVAPDLCSDAHDCSVSTADAWLAHFVPPLLRLPRTAVFVVFDEGSSDVGGGGHVPALALGTAIRPHVRSAQPSGHYVLLRTIEDALGVAPLGASARAQPLKGIWR
jgi:phosphatidylinositol-3-phosphatase